MSRIRCFVAAGLPKQVLLELGRLQTRLQTFGVDARWVAPGSMHLTLKFLGELEPATFEAVCQALDSPVTTGGSLRLEPRGLGAFPSVKRARVVWVGLEGDVALLARAALEVEARVEPLGIGRERRAFHPHLTLGRARRSGVVRGLDRALEVEGTYGGPGFTVEELTLYESRLRPHGAQYIPRLTIPFA